MSPWASGNTAPHPFQMISRMKSRSCPQEVQAMSRNTSITIAPHLPHTLIQPPLSHMQDPQFLPHITNQFPREPALPPEQELVKIPSSVKQECTGGVEWAKQARTPVYTSRVHSCSFFDAVVCSVPYLGYICTCYNCCCLCYSIMLMYLLFVLRIDTCNYHMSLTFEHRDCSLTYSGPL